MIINSAWYNLNANRAYPLDEAATGRDDAGNPVPTDILVDCTLRFSGAVGDRAYISGITVTDRLVSLVFCREGGTAFAAITLPQPVTPERHYAVTPLIPGAGGFVVFGPGVIFPEPAAPPDRTTPPRVYYIGRFSSVEQSFLSARCAQAYPEYPIQSIDKYLRKSTVPGKIGLTGDVALIAGADVAIRHMPVRIRGYGEVQAAVFDLVGPPGRDVFEEYLGCCDARPESRSCRYPRIETINGVSPDCNGKINLIFEGFDETPYVTNIKPIEGGAPIEHVSGTVLDTGLGLSAICQEFKPEPFPSVDACRNELYRFIPEDGHCYDPTTSMFGPPIAQYTTFFRTGQPEDTPVVMDWKKVSGEFVAATVKPKRWYENRIYCIRSSHASATNLMYYEVPFGHADNMSFLVRLRFTDGPTRRAGLIFGYRESCLKGYVLTEYYAVILDQVKQRLSLEHRGWCTTELENIEIGTGADIYLDHWYTIRVEFFPNPTAHVGVSVFGEWRSTYYPYLSAYLLENAYYPNAAFAGIIAENSIVYFREFSVDRNTRP